MARSAKSRCRRGGFVVVFLLSVCLSPDRARSIEPSQLSANGEATLRQLVASGGLSDLRWPDFSDRRAEVAAFYESAGYTLAWVGEGAATRQALALIEILRNAETNGLDSEDYDAPLWAARLERLCSGKSHPSDAELARFDLALTVSAIRYVSDLGTGRANPKPLRSGLDAGNKRYNLSDFLREQVAGAADVGAALAQVEPPFDGYRRTKEALHTYQVLAREDDGEVLPGTAKPLEPGQSYSGVNRLARLLRRLGDFRNDAVLPGDSQAYEGVLVTAVKHFQIRHGLDPDGRIGKSTLQQLNTPLDRRVRQLELVLERWRWVPHEFPRPPIVVNIPEFRLRAYNDSYRPELEMKVVVGRAYRNQTPVFAEDMKYVIFRPYWDVPPGIQRAELVPKLKRDRSYLAENDYEVVDSRRKVVARETITDDTLAQLRSGKLAIRQVPGPKNALGLVKFMFPNQHNVYMHGTPFPSLFARSRRDFSHGCIRVEKPVELAAWVLKDKPEWTPDRIRAAMNGPAPLRVDLERPVPVLIVYGTAVVQQDGEVCFFDDIYGQDRILENLLVKDSSYPD